MQIVKGTKYFDIREFSDIKQMFLQSLELYGDINAFVFRDTPQSEPQSRTYRRFYEESVSLGTALMSSGFSGNRIAVIGDNSYAWCLAYFSIICGLGVSVPLDRLLPEPEIVSLVERGEVDAIVYDASFHNIMLKISQNNPKIKLFICMNSFKFKKDEDELFESFDNLEDVLKRKSPFAKIEDVLSLGKKLVDKGNNSYIEAKIDPEKLMSLLFTSGTTSQAKAVMLSHKNVCADIKGLAGVVKFEPGTRALSVLPIHHTFENTCGFLGGLYFGFTIYESDGLRYIQKNMEEFKITFLVGVPLLFESFYTKIKSTVRKQGKEKTLNRGIKISNALRKVGIDLRKKLFKDILEKFGGKFSIGICGAAPIDPNIIIFFEAIGVRILQGYGLTETSPVVAGCNSKIFVPGTVGHPLTGVEVAIETEVDGEEGEILVRGDLVMQGYYNDEEATAEAIDENGWFHTGDVGRINPKNNCLTITGRKKSMIVLKNGKKVFPEEIEFLLGQYDFIKETLVWGESQEDGDVDVWVKVVLNKEVIKSEGEDVSDEEKMSDKIKHIIKDVNEKMPSFKSIKYFIFGEEDMEKTTTKKIKRNIELSSIKETLEKNSIKIKEAAGRNIDSIKKMLQRDDSSDKENDEEKEEQK